MRLLYLSCHAILEYDECLLFNEMGIDWFSLGSYTVPMKPLDPIRPPIARAVNEALLAITPPRRNIPATFLDNFDVILVMHNPEWIADNWDRLLGRRVIWRTIGQSTPRVERMLAPMRAEGLEIVRYATREATIEDNIGCDTTIHFYKDPNEFGNWNGLARELITFAQSMKSRAGTSNYYTFESFAASFNSHVYGPNNEDSGKLNGGFLSYAQLLQKMRDSRVYFYTGSQPASYTLNFIEAFMSGIPMVCLGPRHANSQQLAGEHTYAIQDFIEDGVNGFVSDDLDYLKQMTQLVMDNHELARKIGEAGRQMAIAVFGKDVIKPKWKQALGL